MGGETKTAQDYFDSEYGSLGFGAQRRYPNEELCRFMGRNFFSVPAEKRKSIRIVEAGCGAGANLWMLAREGFDAAGLDLSVAATDLCKQMLDNYDCTADVRVGDMTAMPFENASADAVVDIFSSHCLTAEQGDRFLKEVARVLKPGGKFFSYFPSTRSDTWTDQNHPDPAFKQRVDDDTLNGLHRADGPYFGNVHPFRFLHPRRYKLLLEGHGLTVTYCETVGRTYRNGEEYFEFVVIEAALPAI